MRLIDADALIKNHFSPEHRIALSYADKQWMRKIIDEEPTIDAEPVRHGHWRNGLVFPICSECNTLVMLTGEEPAYVAGHGWNYCPNCGAKMDNPHER